VVNAISDPDGRVEANRLAIFGTSAESTRELGRESERQCISRINGVGVVRRAKDLHESAVEPIDPPYSVDAAGGHKYDILTRLNGESIAPRVPL
jgi:hypothetical protein